MAYFRSFFGGGGAEQDEQSGAELVEQMVSRLETCADNEDRKTALKALRSMTPKLRVAVGSMGMNAFMEVLDKDRGNGEILFATLEVLHALLNGEECEDDDDLGERFSEVMLKKPVFMPSLLACVEQYDFAVRRASIQLMTSLLRHRGPEVQAAVMSQPSGITCLIDTAHDNREVIRNEAVLMLCELSRNNSQVQQLLAYENAFVNLLDIIQSEPIDSIVIEDSLFVILNLLRKNVSNQQLFRENNLIARLNLLLDMFLNGNEDDYEGAEWAKQRTANVIFLLQVIRSLVSPDNAGNSTHAAQKAINQCKMLSQLCSVLLSETGVSVEVLTETVIVVAECIRGNYSNQEYFASLSLPTGDSLRPSLLVLLISMTAEKQPFKLRCAVFYCFLSYLYDNEFGKTKIVETLLTSSSSDSAFSTGGLICQALTASESVQSWFGSVSLLHCLLSVPHLQEQLLRVQLSTVVDKPPLSLVEHVASQMVSYGNRRAQSRAGLLMLLATWLSDCPTAVSAFTCSEDNLQYLTTQIVDECGDGTESEQQVIKGLMAYLLLICLQNLKDENERRSLEQLIERRIGRDRVVSCLEGLSKTEQFVRAAQKPQPLAKLPAELFLDYHFIKTFKAHEGSLIKTIRGNAEFNGSNNEGIVQSFKELIKRQDEEISVLKHDIKSTKSENENLRKEVESKGELVNEIEQLRLQLQELQSKKPVENSSNNDAQLQEMYRVNEQWRTEADKYRRWAEQWQQYNLAQLPNGQDVAVTQLQQQVSELELQLANGYTAYENQTQTVNYYVAQVTHLQQRLEAAEAAAAYSQVAASQVNEAEAKTLEKELEKYKTEQEDLLVLLADQHEKINGYRRRLRALDQQVSEDEDE